MKRMHINLLAVVFIAVGVYLLRAMDDDAVLQAGAENAARIREAAMRKSYDEYLQELKTAEQEVQQLLAELALVEKIGEDVEFEELAEKQAQEVLALLQEQMKQLELLNPADRDSIARIIGNHIDQRSALAQKHMEEMIPNEQEREQHYKKIMQMQPGELSAAAKEGLELYKQDRTRQESGGQEDE